MKKIYTAVVLVLILMLPVFAAASDLPEPASPRDGYELWSMAGVGYGPRLRTNFNDSVPVEDYLNGWGLSLAAQGFGRQYGWGYFVRNDILFAVAQPSDSLGIFMLFSGGPMYSFYLAPEADVFLGGGFGMTIANASTGPEATSLNLGFALEGGIRYALYAPQFNRRSIGIVLGVAAQYTLLAIQENSAGKDVAVSAPTLYAVPYVSFAFNLDGIPKRRAYYPHRSIEIYL